MNKLIKDIPELNGRHVMNECMVTATPEYYRYVPAHIAKKQTEQLNKAADLVCDLFDDRCNTCRLFNPQHKDCPSCNDMDYFRGQLEEITGLSWEEIKEIRGNG